MADPDKRQLGDGSNSFSNAASNLSRAVSTMRQQASASSAGAAAAGAAKTGKAIAGAAKGAAAAGPWGALSAAAWSARHTLYKLLICTALFFTFIIVTIVSLPSIVTSGIFGLNGTKPVEGATLTDTYSEMAKAVSSVVNYGYELSLSRVDRLIEEGGCDYKLSMDSLINYGHSSAGYDTCYVLAAYSASMEQQNTSKEDMMAKLRRVADSMFPVTSERKEHEHLIPVTYYRYEPVTLTVISSAEIVDFNGDDPVYSYETETRTYYTPVEELSSEEDIMVPAYREVTVYLPRIDKILWMIITWYGF